MTTYPSSWKLSPSTKVSSVANAEGKVGAPSGPIPAPAETARMRERKREEAGCGFVWKSFILGTSYFHKVGEMRKRLEGSQQTPGPDPGDKGPTCGLREEWKGGRWAV